ncbi:hypothetical protein AA0472_0997 [Acetobacter estunensis NRIC 0472]|uniref:Oligosaccharide flippase family protein n=1 Tax=Acetobacter estunensis TaxID=104097 RepID=A0A967B5Y3_9PROT|nr:lipopolysaccharide biosynthesis protein [Acetobacter estunensis]NHO52726.1 oligosaccharide flippase family protein [Acetobacter estunensis]GBQ23136.1 hypothetical protein AA0472_0997 [Acetobacter estunensis NRIC 0472]
MSEQRSVFSSILQNAGLLTAGKIITACCGFVYIAFTVRTIGLSDYGFLILIHSLALMGSRLSRLQSWRTLIHFGSNAFHEKHYTFLRKVVSFSIRLDVISAFAALLISLVGAQIYTVFAHWPFKIWALATLYACVSFLMYTGWCVGVFRLTRKFYIVTVKDSLLALLQMIGVLIGYFFKLKLAYFLMVWAGIVICDFVVSVTTAVVILNTYFPFHFLHAFRNWKWALPDMWKFTKNTSVSQTLYAISNNIAMLIVGGILGPVDVAVYRVCRQIANGIVTPAQLTAPVIYPELVKLRDDRDWDGLRKVITQIFLSLISISAVLLLLSIFAGNHIFAYLVHTKSIHSTSYILIMLSSAIFDLLMVPVEPLLMVSGYTKVLVRNRTIIIAIYFPLLYLMTVEFGLNGACLSTAFSNLLALIVCAAWLPRVFRK